MKLKLKINSSIKEPSGILYVVLVELEGKSLVKIGITNKSIEQRMSNLLVDIFKKYREFPYCRPKRFKTVEDNAGKEAELHEKFKEYKYKTEYKFGGYTEFFDIPLDDVVAAYDELVEDIVDESG